MTHFDEGSSLAPPFNIIVTPKAIYYVVQCIWNTIRWLLGKYTYTKNRNRATIRRPGYSRKRNQMEKNEEDSCSNKPLTYKDIIQRLVARFIHQTKKEMKMDGVNEDDLLEIKQDISSLRFELKDERKKDYDRSSSHINSVKRDILRTMSSSRPRGLNPSLRPSRPRASVAEESEDLTDSEDDRKKDTSSLLGSPSGCVLTKEPAIPGDAEKADIAESDHVNMREPHPALRKTDTSFIFPLNGVPSPSTPLSGRLHADVSTKATSLEAIQNLRNDINQKLDQLIANLSSNDVTLKNDLNYNLSPSVKRHSRVEFIDETSIP